MGHPKRQKKPKANKLRNPLEVERPVSLVKKSPPSTHPTLTESPHGQKALIETLRTNLEKLIAEDPDKAARIIEFWLGSHK